MHQGWAWRRALEDEAGRAALRWVDASGTSPPGTFAAARNDLERMSYLSMLAHRADEQALALLARLVGTANGDVRFAARAALRQGIERARGRERRRLQKKRLKTNAPQVLTAQPAAPSATNHRLVGSPPMASNANRYGR